MRKKSKIIRGEDGNLYRVSRIYEPHEAAKARYDRENYTVISTRVTRDLALAVRVTALSDGKTPSMLVREMLEEYLISKLRGTLDLKGIPTQPPQQREG